MNMSRALDKALTHVKCIESLVQGHISRKMFYDQSQELEDLAGFFSRQGAAGCCAFFIDFPNFPRVFVLSE